jgi:ankyrin repeat/BTB/POZ domain-containing protein 2
MGTRHLYWILTGPSLAMYACAGSADDLRVEAGDILELMAAANFFQLDGLLHYCEYRCADLIDLDTIVSYYIHAKV